MPHFPYLIIGGGMTGEAAARGIREVDGESAIGLISAEQDPPYDRPPLSKGLWTGKTPLKSIWRRAEGLGLELHLGRTAQLLEPADKRVVDDRGVEYTYDKLLLATGGAPRRLNVEAPSINYFRTLADYRRLREDAERGRRFAVIGGGFIGSEIAAALAMNGKEVVMIFPDSGISSRVFPQDLSQFINGYYRERGIELFKETTATGVEARGQQFAVRTKGPRSSEERDVLVDGVVAGLGIQPGVELAQQAGLQVENGIVVDELLRTSHPGIFAAGDVASFANPALGSRLRVEHEDNANTMGRLAGRNMAGEPEPYRHLPYFYSDLFDLGYEAVGELDSRLEVVNDWKDPFREGVVYYLRDGRVRGVLLWNVWDQVDAARRLIADRGPFRPEDLKGRLPRAA